MTKQQLGPIVSGKEITSELRSRKSKDIYKNVTASNKKLIATKVKVEEADGWRIVRKNAKSTRMAIAKPADQQLEDDVWCIFAQMGFNEMSKGRQFVISVGPNLEPRQIDVFAKDDETVVIAECTQKQNPGKKNMAPLIEKIQAIRGPIIKSIQNYYGPQAKLKVRPVIATRNITWSDADLTKCEQAKITVLADGEIDYYASLVQHLKQAARYQLLAHLFHGQKIDGLANEVMATRGKMGGDSFYTFMIRPDDLLKIAYVGHKASRDIENIETYQRMLQPLRLKKIAEYINEGGRFPTNIVLNLKSNNRSGLKFDVIENVGDEALGKLYLPANYASAWIIDGQHRLYGYAYAREDGGYNQDKTTLPVLAFENLPSEDEMNLFIDINSKQVKVRTSLLLELYSDLHWDSADSDKAFQALLSRIASRLNTKKNSPLFDRMVVSGTKKTPSRCLTQTSISDGLKSAKLLGTMSKDAFFPGPLSNGKQNTNIEHLNKSVLVLSECLNMFSTQLENHWNIGDGPGGYLCTNIGIRAIFHVIKDVADHIQLKDGSYLCYLSVDETVSAISPYLQILIDYFKVAQPHEIQAFRRYGSSLTAVRRQSFGMEAHIHEQRSEFCPPGLKEYLDSRDEAGTSEAAKKVMEIHSKLSNHVINTLKQHYGTENKVWWTQGIPLKIRQECTIKWEENSREGVEEAQLFLINYIEICHNNWELFQDVISLGAPNKQNKKENTKWIKELNDIRKITAHPERGVLSKDQVAYVNVIFEKVTRFLPDEDGGA